MLFRSNTNYFKRLHTESIEKLELIDRYYMDIFDSGIKRDYDTGVIMTAYLRLKRAGINTIILSSDIRFSELVFESRDFFNQDWRKCTALWPDTVNSMHTGEGGHEDTANRLIEHIKLHGFI